MIADIHPLLHNEEGEDTQDEDPANMQLRAGYLAGLALKCELGSDDRKMLQRAARSLALASFIHAELVLLRELARMAERFHTECGHKVDDENCDPICRAWFAWRAAARAGADAPKGGAT